MFFGAEDVEKVNRMESKNILEALEKHMEAAYNFEEEFIQFIPVFPPRLTQFRTS
jgi:hypothetical protein